MMAFMIAPKGKRYIMVRLGFHWLYAERGSKPCLRGETHWTKISGVSLNTNLGCAWFYFRRPLA